MGRWYISGPILHSTYNLQLFLVEAHRWHDLLPQKKSGGSGSHLGFDTTYDSNQQRHGDQEANKKQRGRLEGRSHWREPRRLHVLQGSFNYPFWVYHTMQIHGRFEGFPHNSALLGCGNTMTPVLSQDSQTC